MNQVIPDIRVFGRPRFANETVGGMNVKAVRLALTLGAKEIGMPTRLARNHRLHHGQSGGISILDAAGDLIPEALEILDALAGTSCVLGTGHRPVRT